MAIGRNLLLSFASGNTSSDRLPENMSFTPYETWRFRPAWGRGHGMAIVFVGELQHGQRKWAFLSPRFRPWARGALTHIKYILSTQVRNESRSPSAFREEEDSADNDTNLPPLGTRMLDTSTAGTLRLAMSTLPHTGRYRCQPPQVTRAATTSPMPPPVEQKNRRGTLCFLSLCLSLLTCLSLSFLVQIDDSQCTYFFAWQNWLVVPGDNEL